MFTNHHTHINSSSISRQACRHLLIYISIIAQFQFSRSLASTPTPRWACPATNETPALQRVRPLFCYTSAHGSGRRYYILLLKFLSFFYFLTGSLRWLYRQGTFLAQMVRYGCNFKQEAQQSKVWPTVRQKRPSRWPYRRNRK